MRSTRIPPWLPLGVALAACSAPEGDAGPGPRPGRDADDSAAADTAADTAGDTAGDTAEETGDGGTLACTAFAEPVPEHTVDDAALDEISGLAVSTVNPGRFWVLEDQGASPVLTALDENGATVGTITLDGVENVDWEALAVGACEQGTCLWVGDIGDNERARESVALLRIPEPALYGATAFAMTLTPDVLSVRYPDGAMNAEGMALTPDGLPVLVTKRTDGLADIFVPTSLDLGQVVDLALVTTVFTGDPVDPRAVAATAADLTPDGSLLLVRTYGGVHGYAVDGATLGEATELPSAEETQGETIAWDPTRDGYWQISEGENPTMWFTACAD